MIISTQILLPCLLESTLYIPPGTIQGGELSQNKEDTKNVYVIAIMRVDKQTSFYRRAYKIPPSLHVLLLSVVFPRYFF